MTSFKNRIKLFVPVAVALAIMLLPLAVAEAQQGTITPGNPQGTYTPGNPQGAYTGDRNMLQNPLGVNSICQLIGLILKAAMIIGVPIAVLFIVYAGLKFVLARGSPGELSEARSNLIATIIGIAIFLGATLIANVIIATLAQLGASGVTSCTF